MSTTSITHHHRTPYVAAAGAVVAAVAAGVVALSLSGSSGSDVTPGTDHPLPIAHHVWHPTTAGGHVMMGE